ncbi:hypothetical protein BJX65DRAFT_280146 [Aspergillus insuetus]
MQITHTVPRSKHARQCPLLAAEDDLDSTNKFLHPTRKREPASRVTDPSRWVVFVFASRVAEGSGVVRAHSLHGASDGLSTLLPKLDGLAQTLFARRLRCLGVALWRAARSRPRGRYLVSRW